MGVFNLLWFKDKVCIFILFNDIWHLSSAINNTIQSKMQSNIIILNPEHSFYDSYNVSKVIYLGS